MMTTGIRDYKALLDATTVRGGPILKVGDRALFPPRSTDLAVGDIVMSLNFPYCQMGSGGTLYYSGAVLMCVWDPSDTMANLDHLDYSRETARWVVTKVEEEPGYSSGMFSREWYPSSVEVTVQRLGEANELLPEKIEFAPFNYAKDNFLPNVRIVGKAKVIETAKRRQCGNNSAQPEQETKRPCQTVES